MLEDSEFITALVLSVLSAIIIGIEREFREKDAGINTHLFVIGGSMLFSYLSFVVEPSSTGRIAAQIVSGIGFIGAGLILKEGSNIKNLTTAASIWFAAGIGMAYGFGYYSVGIVSTLLAFFSPRIPDFRKKHGTNGNGLEHVEVQIPPKKINKRKK